MHLAENDNGPNPCASIAPDVIRPGLCHFELMGRPGEFALVRLRFHAEIGFTRDAPAVGSISSAPEPSGVPAPSPHYYGSTVRKRRPAFIRDVVQGDLAKRRQA